MIKPLPVLLASLGLASAAWAAMPAKAPVRPAQGPVVVELFQSQGCSDCPPAQANLNAIADRPDVLALSFGVTYWDYLGWKDSFASPRFTARQWDYAHRNGRNEVATPQVWINGRSTIVGSNRPELEASIAEVAPLHGPAMMIAGNRVQIDAGRAPAGGADVWLVRYDPRTVQVAIRAGENGGRTLPHRDVVRELTRIGRWSGPAQTFPLPAPGDPAFRTAVLLQVGTGGPILGAVKG